MRKLVRQANWQRFRNRHAPSFERGLDRLGQQIGVQSFSFQQHRQIEVVLQAAVGHAQQSDGVEFFRDDGVRWVGPQSWCGHFLQQYRIDRINRRRGDGVAEADINLGLAACSGQIGRNDHANAAVASFLADLLDRDGGRVKHDAVFDRYGCDVPKHLGDRLQITGTEAQEVGIACGPVWHVVPEREQQRTFEQKAVRVRRLGQPVEDALQGKAHQHLIEIDALRLGDIEQARTDGCRDIWCGCTHPTLSR